MKSFSEHNPIAIFVYFLCAAMLPMFCMNPAILVFSLAGAVCFYFVRNGLDGMRSHLFFLALLLVMSLINPLFYHNGETVLFVLNDNPVTLEALCYGVASSVMIIGVLYWFRSFSQLMTEDRLLYLMGSASPKLALVLSMALRYVPLFGRQTEKINMSQKALGLYNGDNIPDRIKGGARIFSVMVTWALENGIITADSMSARGYGIGRRTHFTLYRFKASDALLIVSSLLLLSAALAGIFAGSLDFAYYPRLTPAETTPLTVIAYSAYALLSLLPTALELFSKLRWRMALASAN